MNRNIGNEVLEFYRKLPFNVYENHKIAIENIKNSDVLSYYTPLKEIIKVNKIKSIIDIGCGGGWFLNSLAFQLGDKFNYHGVDFNQVAINHGSDISKRMNLNVTYEKQDLFKLDEDKKYDLITSLGVLHHTEDTIKALLKILKLGSNNSYLFVGLYHKYGRKPFLDFIKTLDGLSEDEKFEAYKSLHKLQDDTHLYSWFRDQVLHPHETQHTFEEVSKILINNNYKILSTSINKFEKYNDDSEIINLEKGLYKTGLIRIKEKQYYPGFFTFLAQKLN